VKDLAHYSEASMGDESSESSERELSMLAEDREPQPAKATRLELAPLEGSIYRTTPIELQGFPRGMLGRGNDGFIIFFFLCLFVCFFF
jgi:hypothetical protein